MLVGMVAVTAQFGAGSAEASTGDTEGFGYTSFGVTAYQNVLGSLSFSYSKQSTPENKLTTFEASYPEGFTRWAGAPVGSKNFNEADLPEFFETGSLSTLSIAETGIGVTTNSVPQAGVDSWYSAYGSVNGSFAKTGTCQLGDKYFVSVLPSLNSGLETVLDATDTTATVKSAAFVKSLIPDEGVSLTMSGLNGGPERVVFSVRMEAYRTLAST